MKFFHNLKQNIIVWKKNIFFVFRNSKNYLTKKNDYVKKYLKMILSKQKNFVIFFWQKILQKLFYHKKKFKKELFCQKNIEKFKRNDFGKKIFFRNLRMREVWGNGIGKRSFSLMCGEVGRFKKYRSWDVHCSSTGGDNTTHLHFICNRKWRKTLTDWSIVKSFFIVTAIGMKHMGH